MDPEFRFSLRAMLPRWWPYFIWRHEPREVFGYAPVRRLLGIGVGTDFYFGLVVTGRSDPDTQAGAEQKAENARLREALSDIAGFYGVNHTSKWARDFSRAALKPEGGS